MKLGVVVDGHWGFIRELLADWQLQYQTQVFSFREMNLPAAQGRVNQWRLRQSLGQFLESKDIVFFEWAGPLLVVASHLQIKARILVRLHSFELFDFAPRVRWDSISHVILISNAMQRHFHQLHPSMADRTTVIFNGVPLERFKGSQQHFSGVIGMLANLVPIKRIYEVILALYELNKCGNRFRLCVAGIPDQGADAERYYLAMQRLVRQLGLEQQVAFIGHVSDAAGFLKGIDIFISNSYWEGQSVALLEAMATGCYCLSHHWDGAEEVLPDDHLYLTDKKMMENILSFCYASDKVQLEKREQMRAIASAKFDIENTKTQIRQVIQKVGASARR